MYKTKKMPVSISYGDFKTKASEFLVPSPYIDKSLIGIKSGKEYLYGVISFIGIEISINDIIKKMECNGISIEDINIYEDKLNRYIDQIYKYKISNIISIDLDNDGNIILKKMPKIHNK